MDPRLESGMTLGFQTLIKIVTSEPNPRSEDYTVGQLIITDENNWDYNLLVDLFNEEDRRQIMQILLTRLGREDRMYWIHDKKGAYSVKSGYQLLIVDSFAIWINHNETVWKAKSFTVRKVVNSAKNFLQQWRDTNQPLPHTTTSSHRPEIDRWNPPPMDSFKLNTDAAIFEDQGKTGLGLVIRDDLGSFVAARVVPVQGIFDPFIAEALEVREALSWIKSKFPEVQTIEIDTLLVHSALQNDGVNNS
ncbi:RNase H domain-containing protein [Abeliophyllum distichum]|uniref:RNase H domain-containing protein n=1 Tax=Abeliophyllum distichum TaxID=126358 RepID=A0ABD1RW26_9LAMI